VQHLRRTILTSRRGRAVKLPIQKFLARMGYQLEPVHTRSEDFIRGLLQRHGVNVLVDVGANQGQYARRFRDRGFTGRIVSFEPMKEAFEHLRKEAASDSRWEVRRLAIGSGIDTAELRIAANSVSSSLLPIGVRHIQMEPMSRTVRTEIVRVSTLDHELAAESPEARMWLKLDVQGYELAVLEGAPSVLKRTRIIQCEVSVRELYEGQPHYLEILERLNSAGFTPVQFISGFCDARTEELLQFDLIGARL
jgi:FkbM family methyltransferase